jgi:hypothetical protein
LLRVNPEPRIFSKYLKAAGSFNFQEISIKLFFWPEDEETEWRLLSFSAVYDFSKTIITEASLVELGEQKQYKVLKVDIGKIDRHVFMNKFSVNISYSFDKDPNKKIFSSSYGFKVRRSKFDIFLILKFFIASDSILSNED